VEISNDQLAYHANEIRTHIIRMISHAHSGHPAGALGMADVFTSLYFSIAHVDPEHPWKDDRDRILVSNGHIAPVWYATLAERGYFLKDELLSLRALGSRLQGHPVFRGLPGVENSSGSLGQGIGQAVGVALGLRMKKKANHVFCVVGDGEQQEGSVWEAYWFASTRTLSNLTIIVDRNYIQSEDSTEHVLPLDPFIEKLTAFGLHVISCDGHDFSAIQSAFETARAFHKGPTAIVFRTIPGKGVSFMENTAKWHAEPPTDEQAALALKELESHE